MLGAGALGRPRGMVWGGRREGGSGWGTHLSLGFSRQEHWSGLPFPSPVYPVYKTPQKRSYSDSSFISAKETVLKVEITCSSSSTGLVAPAGLPAYLPARFWPRFGMAWFQTVPLSWWKVGSLGCGGDFRPLSDSLHCCCSSGATRALWPLGVPATSLLTLGAAG